MPPAPIQSKQVPCTRCGAQARGPRYGLLCGATPTRGWPVWHQRPRSTVTRCVAQRATGLSTGIPTSTSRDGACQDGTDVTSWSRTEARLATQPLEVHPPVTAGNSRGRRVDGCAAVRVTEALRRIAPGTADIGAPSQLWGSAPALQEPGRHPWSLHTPHQEHLLSCSRENHRCLRKSPNVP